ncbi:hypothetical protein ZIOFF_027429 [Zingiber officinale]|uniref:TF-B3 domain-containing protein n=1 Tax=Zingiber officinale TaxID=94328 RepID=A0A8J5GSQ5_ZINOF|nr:hypothetical protein ZIOFF_027429 [Zingiber officinale]
MARAVSSRDRERWGLLTSDWTEESVASPEWAVRLLPPLLLPLLSPTPLLIARFQSPPAGPHGRRHLFPHSTALPFFFFKGFRALFHEGIRSDFESLGLDPSVPSSNCNKYGGERDPRSSMAASFERNGINPSAHPHFIKILSPKSLIMLAIPRNFVKHLANSELKTATLVSPCHTFWHVQVLHNQDDELDMQFGRGWELFVQAHRLKPGDAILFRYEGNTVFSVKLFHSDGCCVWCDCNDLDSAPRCIVQDLTVNHESFKQATNTANKERKKNSENTGVKAKYLPYLPQGLVSAAKSEIISLDCLGRLWPVRLWVGKQIAITTGWKQLVRETKLEEGDKCVFETISQGVLGLKIERKT